MRRIGLYYPYVHMRDENWMKVAALYWPRMARVVPRGFPVADSPVAATLHSDLDFLVDVDPEEAAQAVAPRFIRVVDQYESALRERYLAYPERGMDQHRSTVSRALPGTQNESPRPLAGLYWDEVHPTLRDALLNSHLAVEGHRTVPGYSRARWVATDPFIAWAYKCALTDELASRTRYVPTTDQVAAHASNGWDSEQISTILLGSNYRPVAVSRTDTDTTEAVGYLAVKLVIPEDLENLPIAKIVNLRTRYAADFDAFTEEISAVSASLREHLHGIQDIQALQTYLDDAAKQHFETPLENLRKAMNGVKVKTAHGVVNYKFAAGTAVTGLGPLIGQVPVAVGAAALGLAAMRQGAAEGRDAHLRGSPVAFLLRAERDLAPGSLVRRLVRGLARGTGTGV